MEAHGFHNIIEVPCDDQESLIESAFLSCATDNSSLDESSRVDLVHLSKETKVGSNVKESLTRLGWKVFEHFLPFHDLEPKSIVLVLDEMSSPVLADIQGRNDQWLSIQRLVNLDCKILWVTSGSQVEVTNPNNALIHGFARVIRAENPSLVLLTLDVEAGSSATAPTAIDRLLKSTRLAVPKTQVENEFAERDGIIYISRVLPNNSINQAEIIDISGGQLQVRSLHESSTCIRLQCERLGTMDSLQYTEVSETLLPVPDNFVEIEIYAAGLNFKVRNRRNTPNFSSIAISAPSLSAYSQNLGICCRQMSRRKQTALMFTLRIPLSILISFGSSTLLASH